ncbi:MAG: hydrogenase maturation protease [Nitrospirae bacterium]|nr:MAG: hydrogenase maturation protease [Nitrospirota bacterium]
MLRVIGIGNRTASDDAVGLLVTAYLRAYRVSRLEIVDADLAGFGLLDLMEGATQVVLVDAVQSGQEPGTCIRLEIPRDLDLIAQWTWHPSSPSTHAFGIGEVLTMGYALNLLPAQLTVYGIETGTTIVGEPISEPVRRAAQSVAASIREECTPRLLSFKSDGYRPDSTDE